MSDQQRLPDANRLTFDASVARIKALEAERDRYREGWLLRGQKLNEANEERDRLREALDDALREIKRLRETLAAAVRAHATYDPPDSGGSL